MTGVAKNWDIENSQTCKQKLVQIARELLWKRRYNMSNKYTEKGIAVEDDAITLYSLFKKDFFKKNDIRLSNDHFTGETDIYQGSDISNADKTVDIKSSWDWTTFPSFLDEPEKNYIYQGYVYQDLTGSKLHTVAYCLVNTPSHLIIDEKRRLAYKMGIIDTETPEYIKKCIEIEKNCIYDMEKFCKDNPHFEFHTENWDYDISLNDRVIEFDIIRDDKVINQMKQRAEDSNIWLFKNFPKLKEL
jgi:hypothetical protein